jgi:hypothetical protein
MRLDPALSKDLTHEALVQTARQTWGDQQLPALEPALKITADALWRVAQEPLELTDEAPWEAAS